MIMCIWCICLFWQSTSYHRALCQGRGLRRGDYMGYLPLLQKNYGRILVVLCNSKGEFSGRRWRFQKDFKTNWKCELQLHVLPQPQSPRTLSFTVDLRDPPALSATHQQFQGGNGLKAAFLSQTFVFLNTDYNKTNVQTHWRGHWFPKEEVCMWFG